MSRDKEAILEKLKNAKRKKIEKLKNDKKSIVVEDGVEYCLMKSGKKIKVEELIKEQYTFEEMFWKSRLDDLDKPIIETINSCYKAHKYICGEDKTEEMFFDSLFS